MCDGRVNTMPENRGRTEPWPNQNSSDDAIKTRLLSPPGIEPGPFRSPDKRVTIRLPRLVWRQIPVRGWSATAWLLSRFFYYYY